MLAKVISGGQTGVDIAALYAARDVGIPTGGWAPRGWRTEIGSQRQSLQALGLQEHPAFGYPPRTEQNVLDSTCTLIIANNGNSGGSGLTRKLGVKWSPPHLVLPVTPDDASPIYVDAALTWITEVGTNITLNCAGHRESSFPGIQHRSYRFLRVLFTEATAKK